MTGETPALTDPWVEKHGMEYAYAYDKGLKVMKEVGASGFPSAVLLDGDGRVLWSGHPSGLRDDVVARYLPGAINVPLWDWPKAAAKAKKSFVKGDYGKALAAAAKAGDEAVAVHTALQDFVAGKIAGLEAQQKDGDWLAVEATIERLEKGLKGTPQELRLVEIADAFDEDEDAQKVLAAQKKVRKLTEGKIKKGQIAQVTKKLEGILEDHPDTAAARDARAAIQELRKKR